MLLQHFNADKIAKDVLETTPLDMSATYRVVRLREDPNPVQTELKITRHVPMSRTVYCATHAPVNSVYRMMNKAAAKAQEHDKANKTRIMDNMLRVINAGLPEHKVSGVPCRLEAEDNRQLIKDLNYNRNHGGITDRLVQMRASIANTFAEHMPTFADDWKSLMDSYAHFHELQRLDPFPSTRLEELRQVCRELLGRFVLLLGASALTPYIKIQTRNIVWMQQLKYNLARLRNERMERFHRVQKDLPTNNGGGSNPVRGEGLDPEHATDVAGLERQYLAQYVKLINLRDNIVQWTDMRRAWDADTKAALLLYFEENDLARGGACRLNKQQATELAAEYGEDSERIMNLWRKQYYDNPYVRKPARVIKAPEATRLTVPAGKVLALPQPLDIGNGARLVDNPHAPAMATEEQLQQSEQQQQPPTQTKRTKQAPKRARAPTKRQQQQLSDPFGWLEACESQDLQTFLMRLGVEHSSNDTKTRLKELLKDKICPQPLGPPVHGFAVQVNSKKRKQVGMTARMRKCART